MRITHVIISLADTLQRADIAIATIAYNQGLTATKLIEYVLQVSQEDDELFGTGWWCYLETIFTEEQFAKTNVQLISEVFDWMFGELYVEIANQLGLSDPGVLRFIEWLNQTDILLEITEIKGHNKWSYPYLYRQML